MHSKYVAFTAFTLYIKDDMVLRSVSSIFYANKWATVIFLDIVYDQRTSINPKATFDVTIGQVASGDDKMTLSAK